MKRAGYIAKYINIRSNSMHNLHISVEYENIACAHQYMTEVQPRRAFDHIKNFPFVITYIQLLCVVVIVVLLGRDDGGEVQTYDTSS
jgi:hypothetical protein